jgi:hypothetical protein
MNRKHILLALMVLGVVVLAGCGSSNPAIIVQIANVPGTLTANQSVTLSATVTNDPSTGNVNWTCMPSGSCGSFNPAQTANGGTTSYTAPAAAGTVTIVATDADHTGSTATATITIVAVGANSQLSGQYVYFVQGTDVDGFYTAVGSFVADGNGNITSGEQDFYDAGDVQDQADPLTGTYSIAANGQGSMTVTTANGGLTLPNGGVETFSFALTSTTHGLVVEFDAEDTSSGTIDFQTTTGTTSGTNAASITGDYSFATSGEDLSNEVSLTFGGVANLSASSGSVTSGTIYVNDGGTTQNSGTTGSVTGPDAFGRGTISTSFGVNFVYYAVQGEVLRVVESDVPTFITGGTFYGQGAPGTNSTFSVSSLSGTYAFFESGSTVNGPLAIAGQFTAASGNLSAGFADTNDDGTYEKGSIAASPYTLAGNGSGTLTLPGTPTTTEDVSALLIFATDPTLNLLDPNNTASGTGGALIMDNDAGAYGTGLIVPQTTGALQGNYAVNLQLFNNSSAEIDFVGQSTQSGGSFTGTVDLNDDGTTATAVNFSGSSAADSTNVGRYTGSFTVGANSYNITYYQVNSGEFLILDTDSSDVANGFLQSQ